MVDEEIILRFFALNALLDKYRTPLKRFLNEYMNSLKDSASDGIEALTDQVRRDSFREWRCSTITFRVPDYRQQGKARLPNR